MLRAVEETPKARQLAWWTRRSPRRFKFRHTISSMAFVPHRLFAFPRLVPSIGTSALSRWMPSKVTRGTAVTVLVAIDGNVTVVILSRAIDASGSMSR